MAEKLVHTGYGNYGDTSGPIRVYVTYTTSEDISNNTSTITCGMYVTVASGWTIGPWTDVYGSYVGTTSNTFDGTIPNFGGSRTIASNKQFTVIHNSDGTGSATIYWKWGVNSAWGQTVNISGSFSIGLPTIPRQANITSAPNFNDEGNPTIQYSNPAGNSVTSLQACISLTGASADISYRDISKTGTSYTFNLTTAERNTLRNATTNANSRSVIFYVKTVIGGNTYYSTLTKTLSIVNANPTIGATTYQDTNSSIVAITTNNQRIVRNKSTLVFTLPTATALKGASISSYQVTFNGTTLSRSTAGTLSFGTVDVSSNTNATTKVTDSRGNTVTTTTSVIVDDWQQPNAIVTLNRLNNYENTTYLTVDGSISSVNSKNVMTIQYRYKQSGGSYGSLTTIQDNVQQTLTLDKNNEYLFNIVVTDLFGGSYNKEFILAKGKFPLFIDTINNAVGINEFPNSGEALRVAGGKAIFEDGIDAGVTLYTGSGSQTITLSDSSANYSFIEVYYSWSNNTYGYGYAKIESPNGKTFNASIPAINNDAFYYNFTLWSISGTSITKTASERWRFQTTPAITKTDTSSSTTDILIRKVIGYK